MHNIQRLGYRFWKYSPSGIKTLVPRYAETIARTELVIIIGWALVVFCIEDIYSPSTEGNFDNLNVLHGFSSYVKCFFARCNPASLMIYASISCLLTSSIPAILAKSLKSVVSFAPLESIGKRGIATTYRYREATSLAFSIPVVSLSAATIKIFCGKALLKFATTGLIFPASKAITTGFLTAS